ncbi:MAG: ATP synthase F1 subunit gamma [Candidatus Terrybacteria bacterium RIFCSPHIGHO2_01_FULL_48_17]|uniref:ATP synthase gamma chain n=1 Tax=Candidatus Terrybacteria bacterium RIFCSPHIGHO2_01_FULL_48_17 TaxID=1802362 RepID=A0A1G2PKN8_9BACT|nr:MAG: ATP synthase F1 subunit gamma [Candidatus Terrybacteria bacterium RIFCSPHIGHO2_01_FULL_48_17]OHA52918.1 MAG: ATP synthase F1 subunit gamma [Candidatus Terrybacteria bacterium RIFCSPLOWO2_01_FULL_48_14]
MPANIRDLRRRIRATQSIGKITRAMEMIAASKMRKAQQAAVRSKAYAATSWELLQALGAAIPKDQSLHPLLKSGDRGVPLVVLITPNRGLCGALPTQIVQEGSRKAESDSQFMAIGKKGERALLRRKKNLVASFDGFEAAPNAVDIRPIARTIIDLFLSEEINEVRLVYAEFISTVKYEPRALALLPISGTGNQKSEISTEYLFEPNPAEVLDALLPRLIELEIYQAILESLASEHSARMVSMRNASDAARDLLGDFTLTYNSLRQQVITTELADIVGGLKALRA